MLGSERVTALRKQNGYVVQINTAVEIWNGCLFFYVRWERHVSSENDSRSPTYAAVSKSFRTDRLERKLQMVQLSATGCSCIAILWVSLVSFAATTFCVASQRVFVTQSGNFWIIHPRITWGYKVKVKLSLFLTKYHDITAYWGVEVFKFSIAV
jgi:hypothetical protein